MDNNLTIRQKLELREHEILSPYAAFSDQSQGRIMRRNLVISDRFIKGTGIGYCILRHLED